MPLCPERDRPPQVQFRLVLPAQAERCFRVAPCSQRVPSMICSCVSLRAPFQDIFTSDATGTILSAHALAPRPGNVPFVVRFSFTPKRLHKFIISYICL